MNVHLTYTSEYSDDNIDNILKILNSVSGNLTFVKSPKKNFKRTDAESISSSFSFDKMYQLCSKYRSDVKTNIEDFVVLLTARKNRIDWYSDFNKRDLLIQTSDWEELVGNQSYFPIAYLIVESITKSLMGLRKLWDDDKYVHYDNQGCINNYSRGKKEVVSKLKIADVCEICSERIDQHVPEDISKQLFSILENISKGLKVRKEKRYQIKPEGIILNENDDIIIQYGKGIEIASLPLDKTIYIFYLRHLEGVPLSDLHKYFNELLLIYKRYFNLTANGVTRVKKDKKGSKIDLVKKNKQKEFYKFKEEEREKKEIKLDEKIKATIEDLVDQKTNSFSVRKKKLNTRIIKELDAINAPYDLYIIKGGRKASYKINLPSNLIDPRFRK